METLLHMTEPEAHLYIYFKRENMSTFKITVLGAGNIGGTLGRRWV
jgi:hypothetical protein